MQRTDDLLGRKAPRAVMALTGLPAVSAPFAWQEAAWHRLAQQLEKAQMPHALLLVGPEFTGKSRLAMALARLLLCAHPVAGLNCGHCHPCELSASGNHGDFRWVEPDAKSRVIKIDQIRNLVDFSNRTSSFGLRKLVVLSPAESMNTNAANALLKVLEEPAANTYLILVCHRLNGLPATIRSRCQILRLAVPPREQSLAWLDGITGARTRSERLLELAGERPLLAQRLHEEGSDDRLEQVRLAVASLVTGEVAGNTAALAAALAEESLERALAQLEDGVSAFLRGLDGAQLPDAHARRCFVLVDELRDIRRAIIAGSNPNRQLLLDALLVKMQRLLGEGRLGDIIQRKHGGILP